MNIYAIKGHKVKCVTVDSAYVNERELNKQYLVPGQEYTVDKTIVGSWFTEVFLGEIPGISFNSVIFDDVIPQSLEDTESHKDYYKYNRRLTKDICKTIK
jgi:hypothetical protein